MTDLTLDVGAVADYGYKANGPAVVLDSMLSLLDTSGGAISSVTLTIDNPSVLAGEDLNFTPNAALYGNIADTFDAATGEMTLTSAGDTATIAEWQAALQSITFTSTIDPTDGGAYQYVPINWTVTDSLSNTASGQSYVDFQPAIIAQALVTYVPGGPAIVVDPGLLIVDGQSSTITGATVETSFSGDQLSFTANSALYGNILAIFDAATAVLTLTSSGDTATIAQWQAALESVTYSFTGTDITKGGSTVRVVQWTVTDGASNTLVSDSYIEIARPIIAAGATETFNGGGPAVVLDPTLAVSEYGEKINLAGATVTISAGFLAGDGLNFTNQNGITGTYNSSTGVLTLSGTASIVDYQAALESVTYGFSPTNADPTGDSVLHNFRTITWQATDANGIASAAETSTLFVVHTPPMVNAGGTVTFTLGGSPVVLDSTLTVSDPDGGGNLVGATVSIETNLVAGDTLSFTNQNGITGSYDASTGVLTLSGTSSLANYQAALESITYSNADDIGTVSKTIDWRVNDGASQSNTGTSILDTVHTPPTVTASGVATFTGGGSPVALDPTLTASTAFGNAFFSATVTIVDFVPGDILNFNHAYGNISGSYDAATGVLTLTGADYVTDYQGLLRSVTYSSSDPTNGSRTIEWVVNDGIANSNTGMSTLDTVHVAPIISNESVNPVLYAGGSPPVALTSTVTLSDADSNGQLVGATISISGFVAGEILSFTNQNGITGAYDAATGVLTLAGAASIADYQTALRSVGYSSSALESGLQTIDWVVNDGVANSNTATSTVDILHEPPFIAAAGTVTFTGGGSPVALDAGLIVVDDDSGGNLTLATVRFVAPVAGDVLNFTNQNGITGSYNFGSGVLTLSGTASIADYQTALESVTYSFSPSDHDPTLGGVDTSRTIDWQVYDGLASSNIGVSTLDTVHAPPVVTASGTVTFHGGGAPVALDPTLTVADPDSGGNLVGATVKIGGLISGDTLNFVNQNGITGVYDSATGVLTLSGTSTVADYQVALESITYSFSPSDQDPTGGGSHTSRSITWTVSDGVDSSNSGASTLEVAHAPPGVTAGGTVTFIAGHAPVTLDPTLKVSDPDSGGNLLGATVTISGFVSGDMLNFVGQNGIAGVYDAATGVLTLTGTATLADYQAALDSITYSSAHPSPGFRSIQWVVRDGVDSSNTGVSALKIHIPPTVTAGGVAMYTNGDPAVVLESGLLVSDIDSGGMLVGAKVSIGAAFVSGDVLNFTNQNGISGAYNAATGVLTLTGTATVAQYQAALESVTYSFTGADPTKGGTDTVRTLSWQVSDSTSTSHVATSTLDTSLPTPTLSITVAHSSINLGAASGVSVYDYSSGGDSITFGGGGYDVVKVFDGTMDVISLGDGANDSVGVFNAGAGDNLVTLGSGLNDTVFDGSSGDTITLGSGAGDVVTLFYGGGDTVRFGTGAQDQLIDNSLGGNTITFGGGEASLNLAQYGGSALAPFDVINGLLAGDRIILDTGASGDTLAKAGGLGGVAGEALFAPGTYNPATHVFSYAAAGHDALLTYDSGGSTFISVVLVGGAGEISGSSISHGTITLG